MGSAHLAVGLLVGLAVLIWPHDGARRPASRRPALRRPALRRPWGVLGRVPPPHGGSSQVTLSEVADAMVLVALSLRGGRGLVDALADVARGSPPLVAHQLTQVVAAVRWGLPDDQWWSLASPAWGGLAQAYRLAERAGVPPTGLVLAAAGDLRARAASELDERVAALGVRLVLPLGLAFLPGFVLTTVVPVVLTVAASVLPGS